MKHVLVLVAAIIMFGGAAVAGEVLKANHTHDTVEHGGRTNADGCHNETKTGGYHCH